LKGFWHGYVELVLAGVTHEASYDILDGMVQLTIGQLIVVAEPLPGATYEESALYALEQFATGKIVARG
jgi:hypothetical protein